MIFFLKSNDWWPGSKLAESPSEKINELINAAFNEISVYRQESGAWFQGGASPSTAEQVSGAMKIINAYMAAGRDSIGKEEKLIDLCLGLTINPDACNNFNLVLVLYYVSKRTSYRSSEIYRFCLNAIDRYKSHYWPDTRGFSFFIGRSNHRYYGARLTEGLPEPDIHGTHLYLWGIVLISNMLELSVRKRLRPPIT